MESLKKFKYVIKVKSQIKTSNSEIKKISPSYEHFQKYLTVFF